MGYRNPGHPTPCPHCVSPPTLLPSEKAMVAHVHARHPALAPFACLAGCGRYFKSKPGALKHSGTCKPPAPQHHQHHTADDAAAAPPPDPRAAARRECPACGAWLANAASLARHRRTTACAGRKRVWVGGGADPRGAATAPTTATATAPPQEDGAAGPMRHGNRWRRSWVVVDEERDEAEVRGEEPAAVAGRKRRFAEERRPGEGEGEREGKRVKRAVERAPRGRNVERKQEVVQMMGVWSLQKREGGQEQEKEYKQEEFQERVWNLQMQEVKPEEIQELVEDSDEDDEEAVVIRFPMAGKRLPGTISPPRKTVSGKTVPGKAISGKTVAGKTVAGKTVPRKTVPRKTVPRKTVPQSKNEESEDDGAGMEDSETEESEVEVVEWEDESDDDGEESEWDDEDYM